MSYVSDFWNDVKNARATARAEISRSKEQPVDGTCYIVSLKNRMLGTSQGVISLCKLNLAGQRLVEESHRLATDEEIVAYKKSEDQKRSDMRRMEIGRKQTFEIVPPATEGAK